MAKGIIELTDENFQHNIQSATVLVDFWASWCAPCNMLAPNIEEIAETYKDKIKVCKLNVDDNQKTAANFGIVSIPTIIPFKEGREEERIVGVMPRDKIEEKIDNLIGLVGSLKKDKDAFGEKLQIQEDKLADLTEQLRKSEAAKDMAKQRVSTLLDKIEQSGV